MNDQLRAKPSASKLRDAAAQSATSGGEATQNRSTAGFTSQMLTSLCDSGYASGRSNTARTTAKIEVPAPMASASMKSAGIVKPGLLRNTRSA